ncbi:unnamed protein product [Adineta ricciae]|uniref:Uncharacterized protein n=1 Tax=Adineta ricciae TaxID=249248 RepID=A0A816FW07_ADIRI|nr:unnamed protein product [Adineta ricciae]
MNREKHVYERVDGNDFPSVSSSSSAPPPPVPVRMPKKKEEVPPIAIPPTTPLEACPPEQPHPEEWRAWFGSVVNQMSADMKSMSADIRRLALAIEGGVVNQMSANIKSMSVDIRRLTLAVEGGGRRVGGSDEERGRRGVSVGGRPRFNDARVPLRRP